MFSISRAILQLAYGGTAFISRNLVGYVGISVQVHNSHTYAVENSKRLVYVS